jgi:hypothetical protein
MRIQNFRLAVLLLFTIQLFTACNDDPSKLGLDLLPAKDRPLVNTNDTTFIVAENYEDVSDSLLTRDSVYIGLLNDPIFGRITASLLTEIRYAYYPVGYSKMKNKQVRSIVLRLTPTRFIGSRNCKVQFKVFQLSNVLSQTASYRKNSNLDGFINYNNVFADTMVDFSKMIQIDLSGPSARAFGDSLLTVDSTWFDLDTTFRDSALFLKKIFGLCFQPQTTNYTGAIGAYTLSYASLDTLSYLENSFTIKFRCVNYNKLDTLGNPTITNEQIEFGMSSYINSNIYHYPKVNVIKQENFKGIGDSLFYLFSAGSERVILKLNELTNMNSTNGGIYDIIKAELSVPYNKLFFDSMKQGNTFIPYAKSLRLGLCMYDKGKNMYNIMPYSRRFRPFSDYYVDGTPYASKKEIVFNISQYVQEYLTNKLDSTYRLVLIPNGTDYTDFSFATLRKNAKISLKIKYTKF